MNILKSSRLPYLFIGILLAIGVGSTAYAADWTAQGSWQADTTTAPDFTPGYRAQCRIDGVQVYENMALPTPGFSTVLTFDVPQVAECRWGNVNIYYDPPIFGNWSSWVEGAIATVPSDSAGGTLIFIRVLQ